MLLPELQEHCGAEFVSLIETTAQHVHRQGIKTVGLLASPTTLRTRLYTDRLEALGIAVVEPSIADRNMAESLIRAVISSRQVPLTALVPLIERLQEQGAEAVILGCTELSVIAADKSQTGLIDPLRLVAQALSV